jgi:hypothetical protein
VRENYPFHLASIRLCLAKTLSNGAFFATLGWGTPPRQVKKEKAVQISLNDLYLVGNYLLSHTPPNYFTRTAVPVEEFSLLIEDMPCRATTCPTARGAGCTRMEKLEMLVVPVGVTCMTPLPLLCVV